MWLSFNPRLTSCSLDLRHFRNKGKRYDVKSYFVFTDIFCWIWKNRGSEKSSWGVEHCALVSKLLRDSQWIYNVEMIYFGFALVFNVELLCCLNILDKTTQNYMLIVKYMKISDRCGKIPAVQSNKLLGSPHT